MRRKKLRAGQESSDSAVVAFRGFQPVIAELESAAKRPWLRAGSVPVRVHPAPDPEARISTRQSAPGGCLPPCTPHPSPATPPLHDAVVQYFLVTHEMPSWQVSWTSQS